MVYGRGIRNGHHITVPTVQRLWSPEPAHPAIVDRPTWETVRNIAAERGTSSDDGLSRHPAAVRSYAYRPRIRCRDCRRTDAGPGRGGDRAACRERP